MFAQLKSFLLCSVLASSSFALAGTQSFVQAKTSTSCAASSATCSISSLTSTTAGDLAIVFIATTGTDNETISSVTIGTASFVHCPTGNAQQFKSARGAVDCAYLIGIPSGQTSVSITLSAAPAAGWNATYTSYRNTGSNFYFDVASGTQGAASTSPQCASLTLGGADDLVVCNIRGGTPTAVSSPYTDPLSFSGGINHAYALDQTGSGAGTGATWTTASSTFVTDTIAFKNGAGGVQRAGPAKTAGPTKGQ